MTYSSWGAAGVMVQHSWPHDSFAFTRNFCEACKTVSMLVYPKPCPEFCFLSQQLKHPKSLLNLSIKIATRWNLLVLCLCSSIQDLKERIRQRTNLPLGPSIDTHGETFLSQEVVVNLLQETKQAFERCHRVSLLPVISISDGIFLCGIKSPGSSFDSSGIGRKEGHY